MAQGRRAASSASAAAKPSSAGKGQCRACGDWNSLVETVVRAKPAGRRRARAASADGRRGPIALGDIGEADVPRLPTAIGELDRVLGGGHRPGLADPASAASRGSASRRSCSRPRPVVGAAPVLYATGEESAAQVRLRAARLGLLDAPAGDRDRGPRRARRRADRRGRPGRRARRCVVVDSIQTATVDELDGAAGSVGQVRESTLRLMEFAKGEGIAVMLVGHVTKDGSIAGPEDARAPRRRGGHASRASGSRRCGSSARRRTASARPRRSASSRWPATACVEVADPARAFLADHAEAGAGQRRRADAWRAAGRCSSRSRRWCRAAGYGTPARKASGLDPNRLGLLVAVLGRRAGIGLGSPRRLREPGRRAVASPSPASTCRSPSPSPRRCATGRSSAGPVAIGEVGLLGELRAGGRARAAAARGRPARVRDGDRAAARRAARAPVEVAGPARSSRSRRSATRSRPALGEGPRARGERRPGDARLTARPGRPRSGGRPGPSTEVEPLIRYIRVLGAALGGLIGLVLADDGRRPVPGRRLRRASCSPPGSSPGSSSASRSCRT